uniref:Uncharacterized protein n=1 Tax=Anguilla anguilla TaxID=7936 RepID=A0A0E9S0R8_ANGAN
MSNGTSSTSRGEKKFPTPVLKVSEELPLFPPFRVLQCCLPTLGHREQLTVIF